MQCDNAHNYLLKDILFSSEIQILNLCQEKKEIERKVHAIIDEFAERGLRSLAVAFQVSLPYQLNKVF